MTQRRKLTIALLLLVSMLVFTIVFIATTPIFAQLKTNYFSAYAVCQNKVATIKGNKAWEYQSIIPEFYFYSTVVFSDGYNKLWCSAAGIGPFWSVTITIHGCHGNTSEICGPDARDIDYFID